MASVVGRNSSSRLSRIILLVRGKEGIVSAVNFYQQAIGLHVVRVTEDWAELATQSASDDNNFNNGITLSLQAVPLANESQLCVGYSPWITFTVSHMDTTISSCVQMGAHLDGPIQYPAHGKVALLRSPDNHMIGLYEPATWSPTTKKR
jgi:predicted enzyme related to lactoylglutathione lyase